MTERQFEELVIAAFNNHEELMRDQDPDYEDVVSDVSTLRDAGFISYNKGVYVKLADGSAFQLTIVRV